MSKFSKYSITLISLLLIPTAVLLAARAMLYTQLINFKDDDYTAKVAHSEEEACKLIEAGFEFVCDFKGNKLFRKLK